MIFKYLKASGEYSIIFCPFEISKSSFFSIDLIFVLISSNFAFLEFVRFTNLSNHLFSLLKNCFIGSESKNSFAIKIVGSEYFLFIFLIQVIF